MQNGSIIDRIYSEDMKQHFRVMKIHPNAILPSRGTSEAAGYDFFTPEDVICKPKEITKIPLGIKVSFPVGYGLFFLEKSGIATKTSLIKKAGLIDSDYRGQLIAVYYNYSGSPVKFKAGEKVIQGCLLPIFTPEVLEVTDIDETARGEGGFGSTGN